MMNESQSIAVLTAASLVLAVAARSHAAEKVAKPKSLVAATVSPTEASPTLSQVNEGEFEMVVSVENISDADVVLWPCLSAEVLDAKGKPVDVAHRIGWGDRDSPCALDEIKFVELPPRKAHTFRVRLDRYPHNLSSLGWELPRSGQYQVVLHYKFDRDETKKIYGADCEAIDDAEKPWNRAIETTQALRVKLDVKP